ncbi:hypothetical protein [Pseudarthrobacter sp. NBSH8]|nr:hypothetical protein [Pseudarthrobacter sp. NBSH8]
MVRPKQTVTVIFDADNPGQCPGDDAGIPRPASKGISA